MKNVLPQPAYLASFKPYASARSILKGDTLTFFDANESPSALDLDPCELLMEINRYPDPLADALRASIAKRYGVPADQVVAGNGSDELIALCVQAFVRPEKAVVTAEPTYGMYRVCAESLGRRCIAIQRNAPGYAVDTDVLEKTKEDTDLVFLCNPNNPTGGMMPVGSIGRFAEGFSGLVVVDEAYGEFADAQGFRSALDLVRSGTKNIMVLRTFSKAFGAAGIRLGYAIGSRDACERLRAIKLSYNVNALSQRLGILLLEKDQSMQATVRLLLGERMRISCAMEQRGCSVLPSVTNFFLFTPPSGLRADVLYERLKEKGMVVRAFPDSPLLSGLLRFSVGTRAQNDRFLFVLRSLLP